MLIENAKLTALLGALMLCSAAPGLAQTAVAPVVKEGLAAHRAVYEIELADARGGSSVSAMSGRMVYELTGSECVGYTQTMRFVTRMSSQDGGTTVNDMRSTSWEDALAKAFRFNSSQYRDTKLEETTNGDAARVAGPKSEVKVEISKPERKAIRLKSDTYFPVQHSIALLEAARKGEKIFFADLYDGSEKGEKVFSTASFIGAQKAAGYNRSLAEAENADKLNGYRSWPISISYFEVDSDKEDALPSYELAFLYFENGVSRRLFIDYGDFAVRGVLKQLEFLKQAPCDKVR